MSSNSLSLSAVAQEILHLLLEARAVDSLDAGKTGAAGATRPRSESRGKGLEWRLGFGAVGVLISDIKGGFHSVETEGWCFFITSQRGLI